jgi:hypothetical protein
MDVVGEFVRRSVSGGVVHVIVSGRKSGSKGELDGDEKGLSFAVGKVKARGVGDMTDSVGGCGPSVITSSAVDR